MTITDVNPPELPPEGDDSARRRSIRRWFRRIPEVTNSVPSTELVTQEAAEQELIEAWAWVEKHALRLPDRRHVKARVRHAAPKLPGILLKLVVIKLPALIWVEAIGPIWVGAGRCIVAYKGWVSAGLLDDAQKAAEGPLRARQKAEQHKANGHRVYASLFGAAIAAGGMAYTYYVHHTAFYLVVISIFAALELIGRSGREAKKKDLAPAYREPIHEGISYQQLTASIQAAFNECVGVDSDGNALVRCDGVCAMDWDRDEWRQPISTYQEIKREHVEYVERAIGAKLRTVKLLEVPSSATRRILVIQHGDPLINVPSAPDDPAGSCSILSPAPLGVSKNIDQPFAIGIAGTHVIIVAKTGGGKTVHFDNLIDYVSKCRDAVAWGVNLVKRHAFSKWRGCIQKVARDEHEAEALLDAALAEIQRRMDILDERANSDDPAQHTEKWDPTTMGPALIIFVDEFPQLAKYNGSPKGSLNLLDKIETIHRIGREVMVSLVIALQKWGTADSGSTIVSSQSSIVICGPCWPDDAGEIFGYKARDNAGWTPHLLKPANEYGINDAGKAFLLAAGFGPDEVRGWQPRSTTDTIRIANERVQQGLPKLPEVDEDDGGIEEAALVPETLFALEEAFNHFNPKDGWLPSKMAAEWITERTGVKLTQSALASALKRELSHLEEGLIPATRPTRNILGGNCNCYSVDDVSAALGAL